VQETPGLGLSAREADGTEWRLGSAGWAGVPADDPSQADAAVWLVRAGEAVARFRFDEPLRTGAIETVRALQAQGMHLTLLSGDRSGRAQRIGDLLGVDEVIAGSDPEAKLATLRQAQSRGEAVGMVGDGVNDAPVLAAADVSLAMGHGALVAQRSADAVIVSGRLDALSDLRQTSLRTMRVVRQNLAWSAAYNAACIPLAMMGWLPPWLAGLGMASSSVLVILNAQRAGAAPATPAGG
jgi:Cu2+-exporting ATPase